MDDAQIQYINQLLDSFQGECEEVEMANVNDLNPYLSASDVQDGDVLVFTTEGELIEKDFSRANEEADVRTILEIEVKLPSGKTKICSPNKTSRDAIKETFGPDTENWKDKSVKVELCKQNVGGKFRQVIYLTPVKE